jgi:hypothetical protein
MLSANAFTIRDVRMDDVPELVRLGWSTSESWPSGQVLVGEIHGVVAAAFAIDENRAVAAEVPGSARLLAHLRARAVGIEAFKRTPDVADSIRERMRQPVTVDSH